MKLNKILALGLVLLMAQMSFGQSLAGSKHDFSAKVWNTYSYGAGLGANQVCKPCHTPHNALTVAAPLWNHAVTAGVFTLYTNSTFDGSSTITQPDGNSKICLSCHDGSVALDNFIPVNTSTSFITGTALLGTDVSNDHPISFDYTTALATADGSLFDPATKLSGLGGTVAADMLFSNKLQCASCHNAHSTTYGKFLRKSNTGSALCLTCHNK